MRIFLIFLLGAFLAGSCTHSSKNTFEQSRKQAPTTGSDPRQASDEKKNNSLSEILSPYSSEGILILNQYRTNNIQLEEFLKRNRKPDYFFIGPETDYKFQKIYLVYLKNENLYLFDPALAEPYKKFHPLPSSIKNRLDSLSPPPQKNIAAANPMPPSTTQAATIPTSENQAPAESPLHEIEKTLNQTRPQPYFDSGLLSSLIDGSAASDIDLETYYFDKPLDELVENQYSIKYEADKNLLKIIFPQFYETALLYQNAQMDTQKIIIAKSDNKGLEMAVVVPDFLSGSSFYQSNRGNMKKAFSSLYQLNVPKGIQNHHNIRMRFQLKICQNDTKKTCISKTAGGFAVRGVVLSATFYDGQTRTPIETITLK